MFTMILVRDGKGHIKTFLSTIPRAGIPTICATLVKLSLPCNNF